MINNKYDFVRNLFYYYYFLIFIKHMYLGKYNNFI